MSTNQVRECWKNVSIRKDFTDPKVKFEGEAIEYPAFKDHLKVEFANKGILGLLRPLADRPTPSPPWPVPVLGPWAPDANGVMHQQLVMPVMTLEMMNTKSRLDATREKVLTQYEMGLALVQKRLGAKPTDEILEIARDPGTAQAKFNQLIDLLDGLYLANPDVTMLEIQANLDNCPKVITPEEGLKLMSVITHTELDLMFFNPATGRMTEQAKRFLIMKKLEHSVFSQLIMNMQDQPHSAAYTYVEIRAEIMKMVNAKKVMGTDQPTQSAAQPLIADQGATTSLINSAAGQSCRNCQGTHSVRDCPKMCTSGHTDVCRQAHFHSTRDCPEFKQRQRERTMPYTDRGQSRSSQGRPSPQRGHETGARGGRESSVRKAPPASTSIYERVVRSQPQGKRARINAIRYEDAEEVEEYDEFNEEDWDEQDYDFSSPASNRCTVAKDIPAWSDQFLLAHKALNIFFRSRPEKPAKVVLEEFFFPAQHLSCGRTSPRR